MALSLAHPAALPIVAGPMGSAATLPAAAGAAGGDGASAPPLVVPDAFAARLDAAMKDGQADAATFLKRHGRLDAWRIGQWAEWKLPFPPKTDDADLAELHAIAKTRTPQGVARAKYWASHGLDETWQQLLAQYTSAVSPAQARAAQRLLDNVLMSVNEATQITKSANLRTRPFIVDPSLELVVPKPGNNPSYPSGHTTAAFAAALVLAHLMPDRRDEFLGLAREASWARLYGGVHFPTDVLAGARLATTITDYMTRTSGVAQVRGTGARILTALPMGSRIAGTPLDGAVQLVRT